ncbi:GDP-mannose mannosyl hydrolase [Achromobacter spanius]|uniref:GDP-mannose mannosyl hydrolase n=1 Tax=Achromobacter spanius TaxID=217203 RepID=UPI0036E8DFE2
MVLTEECFRHVVENAPLISIDLILKNLHDQVLLGLRTNRPAKGSWFVPGGRVRKGESIAMAFSRLAKEELGTDHELRHASFLGVYEHFYDDSVFGADASQDGTHYIVLGYQVSDVSTNFVSGASGNTQHIRLKWWGIREALLSTDVHEYTKAYLAHISGNNHA